MVQIIEQDERFKGIKKSNQNYRFINPESLPPKALIDPDFRLRILERQFGMSNPISCSKCHHCR